MPPSPTKIVCVGRNYVEHARELGNEMPERPLLFLKPPSSIVYDGDVILLPADSQRVEHEADRARRVGTLAARERVGGAGCNRPYRWFTAPQVSAKCCRWAFAGGRGGEVTRLAADAAWPA